MKKYLSRDVIIILLAFTISRICLKLAGVEMPYDVLFKYWQYLDVETLQHNLIRGVWYNHAAPPFYNTLLGLILKTFGVAKSEFVIASMLKLTTLANGLLIYAILKRLPVHPRLPLLISLLYLLSPGMMVFENELFYVTLIGTFFLVAMYFVVGLQQELTWKNVLGFFIPLLLLCLTRGMYHLVWLFVISSVVIIYFMKRKGVRKLIIAATVTLTLVGSWYVKNYIIFGNFGVTSWVGMNMARIVFHDADMKDSTKIGAYMPFSKISTYNQFITSNMKEKFKGVNDRDLLNEYKNDSLMNLNHIDYLEVSNKYMEANKQHIKDYPVAYMKNVVQSAITYFAPATRYSVTEFQVNKIWVYDLVYSFNLSHFAEGKQERRVTLALSAIPKIIIYLLVFVFLVSDTIRNRRISLLNLLIVLIVGYGFVLTSLIEHYENMRFRFEVESLFLIVMAQAITAWLNKRKRRKDERLSA